VCTVTAAALLEMRCIVIQHAFATLAVDALVIGAHESFVEHPRLIAIVVVETQPLMDVLRLWHLSDDS